MTIPSIRPEIADRLLPFCQAVQETAGERLHSLYLSGSAVTPDYLPGISDINTVIVLREIDLKFLQRLAPLGKKFARQKIAAPLIITPDYCENSLDVFPIEFLDLQLRHQVLAGSDLFTDLEIDDADLRLQCEREIKARVITLRQDYLAATGQRRLLAAAINRAFASLMPVCRGLVRILHRQPPVPITELLTTLADLTGIDDTALVDIFTCRQRQTTPEMGELNLIFANFYRTLERLGKLVDAC